MSSCGHHDDVGSEPEAAMPPTPLALVPRSHQLVEKSGAAPEKADSFIAPRALSVTPVGQGDQGGTDSLWISASGDPDTGGVPLTVSFTGETQGGPGDLRYRWDFGDNSPPAFQLNTQHTYRSVGDFTATLTVSGPGAEETDDVYVQVAEEGFDVSIDADPDIGKPPLAVHFSAVLDDDLPGPFTYQWDFGDGAHDVSNPTTHTYQQTGQFTATCVVTNSQGQIGRQETDIQVDSEDDQGTQ